MGDMGNKQYRYESYKVVTNYYLMLCNAHKQRAYFNAKMEWE